MSPVKIEKSGYFSRYEKKLFSQHGEDGIVEALFNMIGVENQFYVEFGAADGLWLSNTRNLREQGWEGVLFDCDHENPSINLYRAFINAENVNEVFARHNIPKVFDFLSIDIDGNDWYVWRALNYKPRVVVVEYNRHLPRDQDLIIVYDPHFVWDRTTYYSASITSFFKLARTKGYTLVCSCASNLFFVEDKEVPKLSIDALLEINRLDIHYSYAITHRPDLQKRHYVRSGLP